MTYPKSFIAKAIVAFLTALGTWGFTAASDGSIELIEWFGLAGVLSAAAAVYAYPNSSPEIEPDVLPEVVVPEGEYSASNPPPLDE